MFSGAPVLWLAILTVTEAPTPPTITAPRALAPALPSKPVGAAKPTETMQATAGRKRRPRLRPAAKVVRSSVGPALTAAPSLSPAALRAELAHPTPENEILLRTVGDERARLEQLGAEIATARTGLRQDTARLEAILRDQGRGTGRGQIDVVAKAMGGMKPERAAAILTRLDRALAADVLRRMKASDAGAAMGQLRPEVAAEIATEIAVRLPARAEPAKENL